MRFIDEGGKDPVTAVGRPTVLRIESWSPPHDATEPDHTHPEQVSRFEMYSGELAFMIAGKERRAGPGDTVTIPAGVSHRFWNPGGGEAHYLQVFEPALDSRRFFEVLFRLANEGKLDRRGMPLPLHLPVLVRTFHREIHPTSPPWLVTRLAAAALAPIAALRGYRSPDDL